ncbi:MAG: hypothetical protein Q9161_006329 [Pseudevernia consocians]
MSETSSTSLSTSPEPKQSTTFIRPKKPTRTAKRKRNDGEDQDLKVVVKSAKRKRSKTSNLNEGLNLAIAKMDSRLLADYVFERTKRFFPDFSLVELEDRFIPGILGAKYFRPQ